MRSEMERSEPRAGPVGGGTCFIKSALHQVHHEAASGRDDLSGAAIEHLGVVDVDQSRRQAIVLSAPEGGRDCR